MQHRHHALGASPRGFARLSALLGENREGRDERLEHFLDRPGERTVLAPWRREHVEKTALAPARVEAVELTSHRAESFGGSAAVVERREDMFLIPVARSR